MSIQGRDQGSPLSTADPTRVLYLIPRSNNPNLLLQALTDRLHPHQVEFQVVLFDEDSSLSRDLRNRGIRVLTLGTISLRTAAVRTVALRRVIRAANPDILHSHVFWPTLIAQLAVSSLRRPPALVATRHHNLVHHLANKRLHVLADRAQALSLTRMIAVSHAVARTLVHREKVPFHRVTVIHNGLDPAVLQPDLEESARWRSRLRGDPLLVAVGRLSWEKDYPTMFRAFRLVLRSFPHARLVIAGGGHQEDLAQLKRTAAQLAIHESVSFLGFLPRTYDLMKAADVFVQTSIDEAFSLTILEALILAVPLVATSSGGTEEALAGIYESLEPGDVERIAEAIVSRIQDKAYAIGTAERGRLQTIRHFSSDKMADRHLNLYRSLASRA